MRAEFGTDRAFIVSKDQKEIRKYDVLLEKYA